MYGHVERITPEQAQAYLNMSRGNRPLSRYRVDMYAESMKQGKWQVTGQGISIDEDGVLKDGHHRLHAIIQADMPVFMWVCHDVPSNATEFDTGYGRSMTQQLRYNHGLPADLSTSLVAAMVKLHYEFSNGAQKAISVPTDERANFISGNETDIRLAIGVCAKKGNGRNILLRASFAYSIFCAIKCGVGLDTISDFCNIVATGFYTDERQSAAVVVRNATLSGFDLRSKKARDTASRMREAKVIQMGLYDFAHETPRKRMYAADKCMAIYTDQYLNGGTV